jgi:hypothetical protein
MVALAKAQGQIPDIERDRTVTVQPRLGTAYHFKYATLAAIIKGIKKALSDNGIAYTQVLTFENNDKLYYLTTSLHFENQFISSVTPLIISDGTNQQFGSALTYMKRYALAALVGVAAEEDDDGNAADGNEVQAIQQAGKPNPPAPDPIKTIKTTVASGGSIKIETKDIPFNGDSINVPFLADNSNHDWLKWGQMFMEQARKAPHLIDLEELEANNIAPLKNMQEYAAKMYTNMSMALIKVRKELEKKDAE